MRAAIFPVFFLVLSLSLGSLLPRADYNNYLEHKFYELETIAQGEWNDISSSGTVSYTSDADDSPYQPVELGFTFPFFGHPHSSLLISPNGFLALDLEARCPGYGFCGWSPTSYLRFIAPFMTDFDASAAIPSRIYFAQGADAQGMKTFTVQFENLFLWNSTFDIEVDTGYTFQVVISADGTIRFNYKNVPANPTQLQNHAFSRAYPLVVGIQESVLLDYDGFYVASPYKPVSIDFASVKAGASVVLTALPSCFQYTDCYSCATKSEKETGLKCGWCGAASLCADGVGKNVNQILGACPSPNNLQLKGSQCANNPGRIAGIVIGSLIGVALLSLTIFIIYRRFRKYIASIEGRMGGKKDDELPQLDSQGKQGQGEKSKA